MLTNIWPFILYEENCKVAKESVFQPAAVHILQFVLLISEIKSRSKDGISGLHENCIIKLSSGK
jgi:hypothetical protein